MPFLATAPAWLGPVLGLGASAVGGALGNKSTQTSTPTMDPAYGPLQSMILGQVQNRLANGTDLSGYTGSGISNINQGYNAIKTSQNNDLTARGLASSPVAGAVDATRENARAGDIASFRNSIPLLQRQFQNEDLGSATNLLGLGRGVNTTGNYGGGAGGAATNLAGMLGYLTAQGMFKRSPLSPSQTFNAGIMGI